VKKIVFMSLVFSLVTIDSFTQEQFIIGLDGRSGFYNAEARIAYLSENGNKTVYINVVEYSQAVTPPNVANHGLKPFATMLNSRYQEGPKKLIGGQTRYTILFGIEKKFDQDHLEHDNDTQT